MMQLGDLWIGSKFTTQNGNCGEIISFCADKVHVSTEKYGDKMSLRSKLVEPHESSVSLNVLRNGDEFFTAGTWYKVRRKGTQFTEVENDAGRFIIMKNDMHTFPTHNHLPDPKPVGEMDLGSHVRYMKSISNSTYKIISRTWYNRTTIEKEDTGSRYEISNDTKMIQLPSTKTKEPEMTPARLDSLKNGDQFELFGQEYSVVGLSKSVHVKRTLGSYETDFAPGTIVKLIPKDPNLVSFGEIKGGGRFIHANEEHIKLSAYVSDMNAISLAYGRPTYIKNYVEVRKIS